MRFTSPIKYSIGQCTATDELTVMPVQPGDEVDKIWTIRKNTTTLSIECNGVEVLNYHFSDSSDTDCVTKWAGDVMKIKFSQLDTASDGYVEKPTKGNDVDKHKQHQHYQPTGQNKLWTETLVCHPNIPLHITQCPSLIDQVYMFLLKCVPSITNQDII